jgi:hypothetical protein
MYPRFCILSVNMICYAFLLGCNAQLWPFGCCVRSSIDNTIGVEVKIW